VSDPSESNRVWKSDSYSPSRTSVSARGRVLTPLRRNGGAAFLKQSFRLWEAQDLFGRYFIPRILSSRYKRFSESRELSHGGKRRKCGGNRGIIPAENSEP
jgi:hypothetical protein